MSARHERHARSKDYWDSQPPRSSELAAVVADQHPEPVAAKKAPGRKNTRDWCKGKPGREHEPVIVLVPKQWDSEPDCQWGSRWPYDRVGWACRHRDECSSCGKVLRYRWELQPAECPAYPGDPEQKAAAEARRLEAIEQGRLWRLKRRRPVISGKQGYRRKRPA